MKFEFFRQIFEKSSDIKFLENSSTVSRVDPCGRTDGRHEANNRFLQFCERFGKKDTVPNLLRSRVCLCVCIHLFWVAAWIWRRYFTGNLLWKFRNCIVITESTILLRLTVTSKQLLRPSDINDCPLVYNVLHVSVKTPYLYDNYYWFAWVEEVDKRWSSCSNTLI
jgi:hypothetical protein